MALLSEIDENTGYWMLDAGNALAVQFKFKARLYIKSGRSSDKLQRPDLYDMHNYYSAIN